MLPFAFQKSFITGFLLSNTTQELLSVILIRLNAFILPLSSDQQNQRNTCDICDIMPAFVANTAIAETSAPSGPPPSLFLILCRHLLLAPQPAQPTPWLKSRIKI